jgi:hypothetical protein
LKRAEVSMGGEVKISKLSPPHTHSHLLQATWSADAVQSAQLLTRDSRDLGLSALYDYCLPPPNFAPLDPYSEDRTSMYTKV